MSLTCRELELCRFLGCETTLNIVCIMYHVPDASGLCQIRTYSSVRKIGKVECLSSSLNTRLGLHGKPKAKPFGRRRWLRPETKCRWPTDYEPGLWRAPVINSNLQEWQWVHALSEWHNPKGSMTPTARHSNLTSDMVDWVEKTN